jgi:hypothetical protein
MNPAHFAVFPVSFSPSHTNIHDSGDLTVNVLNTAVVIAVFDARLENFAG